MGEVAVLETLARLVAINSINPGYEGGTSEEEVAAFVERFFASVGVETFRQSVLPGRSNVIARLEGRNPQRRVVLEAHMDTVSVVGMEIPPFEPSISNGRLFGRGSCDTKASLAAMMHALAEIKQEGSIPPCEVWLAAVVDEEVNFRGVTTLCASGLQANAAIVGEPTGLAPVIASKGVLRWKIRTQGKAAHSSKPHLGVSAIEHMVPILQALGAEHKRLQESVHPLLGPGTLNVGVIRGGTQVNFVPDKCEIEIDRRLLPGEDVESVLQQHARMLFELQEQYPGLIASMEPPELADAALETAPNEKVVTVAQDVLAALGLPSQAYGVPFGSDASKLSRHGVPSIIFGPGSIDQAHAAVEYVDCGQVITAASFFKNFLLQFE
jgi:acetylornithine deacetylase ArgE